MLWIYDRVKNEYRQQSIKNTAAITNYYSFESTFSKNDPGLEHALSVGESICAPIISKISKGNWRLTVQDRWELAAYIALLWTRTPTYQKKVEALFEAVSKVELIRLAEDEKRYNEAISHVEKKTGEKLKDREAHRTFMKDPSRYRIDTSRLASLQTMVVNLKETYEVMYQMWWNFYYLLPEKAIITSDNPVYVRPFFQTSNPLGYALLSPHTATFIVLTPNVCMTMINNKEKIGIGKANLDDDMTDDINNYTALYSRRFVFSGNLELLKSVVNRTSLHSIKPYKLTVSIQMNATKTLEVTRE